MPRCGTRCGARPEPIAVPCAGGSGGAGGAPGSGARGFLQEQGGAGGAGGAGVIPAAALERAGVQSRPPRASVSPTGGAAGRRVRFAGSAPNPPPGWGRPRALLLPTCTLLLAFSVSFRSFFAHRCFPAHTPSVRGEETAPGRPGGLPALRAAAVGGWGGSRPLAPLHKELCPALPPIHPAAVVGMKRGVSSGVFGGGDFARVRAGARGAAQRTAGGAELRAQPLLLPPPFALAPQPRAATSRATRRRGAVRRQGVWVRGGLRPGVPSSFPHGPAPPGGVGGGWWMPGVRRFFMVSEGSINSLNIQPFQVGFVEN